MAEYTIINTQPHTYLDPDRGAVTGVKVVFRMLEFDERAEINLPKMDATAAKAAIEKYIAERKALMGK